MSHAGARESGRADQNGERAHGVPLEVHTLRQVVAAGALHVHGHVRPPPDHRAAGARPHGAGRGVDLERHGIGERAELPFAGHQLLLAEREMEPVGELPHPLGQGRGRRL